MDDRVKCNLPQSKVFVPSSDKDMTMTTILSLHPEAEILKLLHLILTRAGYTHLCADDSETALAFLRHEHIDLLIQNLMRPKINGCALYQILQNDEKLRSIPVLIVTSLNPAYVPETCADLINKLYPDNYLIMPFSPQTLIKVVKNILARSVAEGMVPPEHIHLHNQKSYNSLWRKEQGPVKSCC